MIAGTGCTPDDLFFDTGSKGYDHTTENPFVENKNLADEYNARNRTRAFLEAINNRLKNDRKVD